MNLHPICHEIPHLLDTQKGRLCLFFIWTVGDGARCLAAAECSGVTVPVTGHDEQPRDEGWGVEDFGKSGHPTICSPKNTPPSPPLPVIEGGGENFLFESLLAGISSSCFLISRGKAILKIQLLIWGSGGAIVALLNKINSCPLHTAVVWSIACPLSQSAPAAVKLLVNTLV